MGTGHHGWGGRRGHCLGGCASVDGVGQTIGVEEEFHIVDPGSGELCPAAGVLLATPARVTPELHRTMIETASGVCTDLGSLRDDLAVRRSQLIDSAGQAGLAVAACGTVPGSGLLGFGRAGAAAGEQQAGFGQPLGWVYPAARYRWMYEEYRQLVVEQQVCACQVQVGVPDRDLAVRVCRRVRAWLPVLLALSASSPMFQGVDTGYASFRTVAISRWPTVGPPPDYASAAEYDDAVTTLVDSGVIIDPRMVYYDVRPSARYPTVEIRIADSCPLIDDVVLLAALSRALVVTAAEADRAGDPLPHATVLLRAATWRAARSGLDGDLVDPVTDRSAKAGAAVAALLDHVRSALVREGSWSAVQERSQDLLARGTSSSRQRILLRDGATGADVVRSVVAETRRNCRP